MLLSAEELGWSCATVIRVDADSSMAIVRIRIMNRLPFRKRISNRVRRFREVLRPRNLAQGREQTVDFVSGVVVYEADAEKAA